MGVTHTFVDYIPAILLQGRGYEAIRLTVIGGVGSILLAIAVLTGTKGLLVAFTAIGSIPPLAGVRRSNCMAVLVIPPVLYFL